MYHDIFLNNEFSGLKKILLLYFKKSQSVNYSFNLD